MLDMDKPIPEWLQSGLVFAGTAFVAAVIDLYVISLIPFVVGGMAVWIFKRK